jgi:hypothetical protein
VMGFNFPASLVIMLLLFKGSNLGIAQNYPISSYACVFQPNLITACDAT